MNTGAQKQHKPAFIVICGGEGSGKSTVLEVLQKVYAAGSKLAVTREPGGSEYAEEMRKLIRDHPLARGANADTMFGLFWASRADTLHRKVQPLLGQGISIISDRGDCCTFAYQIRGQEEKELERLFWQTRKHYLRKCMPDLYIFLDVTVEEGLKRVAGRPGKKNHFDERDIAFHERVRRGYLEFIEQVKQVGSKAVVVNANRSRSEVQDEVIGIVGRLVS